MSSGAGPGPGPSNFEEFSVRIPRDGRRKFTMMKFGTGSGMDFTKVGEAPVKMERENNYKEFRTAHDIDTMPKFGAGSEYGRDLKEESRRKKYGIMRKKYYPENQPWHLKIGAGKQTKKYKGVREGSISENTAYYIFTKAADGAFEACPVQEWYNFTPQIRYKFLNSEEAEEEFLKRDKTLNYFNIMLKKKYQKDDDLEDDEEEGKKKKGGKSRKKKKDLKLTDMDDFDDLAMSDDDDDDSDNDEDGDEDGKKSKKKGKKGVVKKKKSKNSKHNSDDEAIEESDEGDGDDREVDYMSDSDSSDSAFSGDEKEKKGDREDDKGVDQEAGLKNILDSDAEDEEEEDKEKEEAEEDPAEKDVKKEEKKKGAGGADDSSSSSSDDDSDIEKDANKLAKELLLEGDKKSKKEKKEKTSENDVAETSVKTEPNQTQEQPKDKVLASLKRKPQTTPTSSDTKPPMAKKHKLDDSESLLEDDLRRYLQRKPMTTKSLLQKFKNKKLNMSNERIQQVIVQLLKKINPDKTTINKQLFLSLKAPE